MSEGKILRKSGIGNASHPLDVVLAAWPAMPGDDPDPEVSARRILALIASDQSTGLAGASPAVSDADLVGPPLPALPGEPQGETAIEPRREGTGMTAASRERNRASLRDLARLANADPSTTGPVPLPSLRGPSSDGATEREEGSGVVHLAALGAANALPAGGEADPSAAAAARATALATTSPSLPSRQPWGATPGAAVPLRSDTPRKKSRPWMGIGFAVAGAAVAAGMLFGARHVPREEGSGTVTLTTPPPQRGSLQPGSLAPTVAQVLSAMAVASGVPEEKAVDPSSLPPESTPALVARRAAPASSPAGPPPAMPSPARTTGPAPLAEVPAATASLSATASLQTLMQQAAGVTSAPAVPAPTSPEAPLEAAESVPLRPSQGALQGALGAALPSARACLGPDDAISHATITFGSDGTVVNVGVSGGAAGKPAESCIRAALMKARVAPFARPTFTGTATVRPN